MAHDHDFTFKIQPRAQNEGRHRFTIFEGEQERFQSPESYATKREADIAADKALKKLLATLRTAKQE